MLLSFLGFSSVTHLKWPSHVTCDTCAESHPNALKPINTHCLFLTPFNPERKVARRVNAIPTIFFFRKTTALLTSHGFREAMGNAGGGGGNVPSLTAVDARLGALLRAMNTDGFASNACTKFGTSCNNQDRTTQPF